MASELCMNCFSVKGQYEVCPFCGYVEGTPPEQPHYLTPGTILGNHFIVGTVIGFGGFGITYKCFDTTLGVTVAAKEFYPIGLVNRSPGESRVGLLSGDKKVQYKEQLSRFLMEAQSVAQFGKAKDIVNIYDFFEENGTAYIIMEYIDGVLLKDYLERQGAMSPNVAMSVIMPIIEAVKKIHSKGIIHRDISPDNIFITDENSIKIFDFGAAQLNESKEGMAGEKVIKVGYSAPEQYRNKSRQNFYTDIYSVGAIMYQMLTGIKPMESTEREYKDELKSPMELGVNINSNVDRAVMEAMAVRPELRFQGIQQFEDALRSKRVAEYPKDKIRKRKRKRNWIIGTAATLVLAVGVGIGLFSTILKPESAIFDSTIAEDTNVTIWVENEDQKEQLESLVKDGFLQGELSTDEQKNPDQWEKFWSENEKVDVDITVHKEMQKDLQSAKEQPNMFITDHVSDSDKENLISLQDVYTELNIDDYAYMSEYERFFPNYKEMPTGLDTLLLYACTFEYNKDNTLFAESLVSATKNSSDGYEMVELDDLINSEKKEYTQKVDESKFLTNKLATFYENTEVYAMALQNEEDWNKFFSMEENFIPDISTLTSIQSFNQIACQPKFRINSKTEEKKEETSEEIDVYGNNIVAGAAYRKVIDDAMEVAKEDNGSARRNLLKDYRIYVITHNDKMLVEYSERYGITENSNDNQKTACKRLLYLMLQGTGQKKKEVYSSRTTFPIRSEQLENFVTIRTDMKSFINLCVKEYSCEIVGCVTGNMHKFAEGLGEMTEKQELQNYCSEFTKNSKSNDKQDE